MKFLLMKLNKYYLAAFSCFFIWGFFGLALRPLHDYPSLDILFYRVFFAAALLLLINLMFRKNKLKEDYVFFKNLTSKQKRATVSLTILGGFLLIFNWYLFMHAVNHVSLQSASFAYLICPIITTILAFFILNEKLSKWQWIAVFLCAMSCSILSYGHIYELFYSLIIAISFALYLISQRKNNQFDRFVILTVQLVIASLVITPFFPTYSGPIPTANLFYTLMMVIVVLFTIIPLFLNLYALKGMNSSAVGILMYTNPLINFFLAIFYFHEEIHLTQIISYSLIFVSIVIFSKNSLDKSEIKSVD